MDRRPINTNLLDNKKSKLKFIYRNVSNDLKQELSYIDWGDSLSEIQDQGNCGSCWAYASLSCLEDRFRIYSKGYLDLRLSVSKLILCTKELDDDIIHFVDNRSSKEEEVNKEAEIVEKNACKGNTLDSVWLAIYLFGVPETNCINVNLNELQLCTQIAGEYGDSCGSQKDRAAIFYRSIVSYRIPGIPKQSGSMYHIMHEIQEFGPVTSAIDIYSDFFYFNFKEKVYKNISKDSTKIGGHAVKIVGWGETNSIKYWWVANSFGKDWGEFGYFRILRGVNFCGIEERVYAGIPDFFYPLGTVLSEEIVRNLEYQSDDIRNYRLRIDYGDDVRAGGIDPSVGIYRRVLYNNEKKFYEIIPFKKKLKILYDTESAISKSKFIIEKYKYEHRNHYELSEIEIMLFIFVIISLYSTMQILKFSINK